MALWELNLLQGRGCWPRACWDVTDSAHFNHGLECRCHAPYLLKTLSIIFFSSEEFKSIDTICIASASHSFLLKLKTMICSGQRCWSWKIANMPASSDCPALTVMLKAALHAHRIKVPFHDHLDQFHNV